MKITHLKFLCLFISSCLLFGCKPNTTKTSQPATTVSDDKTDSPKSNSAPNNPNSASNPPDPAPSPVPSVNKLCGDANFDIESATNQVANELKDIMYNREASAKADCSGIYHRVLDKFRTICPDAKTPSFNQARDSRSLAAWYKKNGHLKIIRNPADEADLIQPGAVMFYGYGNRRNHYDFQKMNMDTLTLRGTGINHIAIVTSVNRVDGELISYKLFHGRTDNKVSAITDSYKVTSWDKTWPMYGNSLEPWLAVAISPFGM